MSSCPPSALPPSNQALCQGAIKPANACLHQKPFPRSAAVLACDPPYQSQPASPISRMRQADLDEPPAGEAAHLAPPPVRLMLIAPRPRPPRRARALLLGDALWLTGLANSRL